MQGHEEFDDEITLAGSGRVTPSGEVLQQLSRAASPEDDASGPVAAEEQVAELPRQAASGHDDRYPQVSVQTCPACSSLTCLQGIVQAFTRASTIQTLV